MRVRAAAVGAIVWVQSHFAVMHVDDGHADVCWVALAVACLCLLLCCGRMCVVLGFVWCSPLSSLLHRAPSFQPSAARSVGWYFFTTACCGGTALSRSSIPPTTRTCANTLTPPCRGRCSFPMTGIWHQWAERMWMPQRGGMWKKGATGLWWHSRTVLPHNKRELRVWGRTRTTIGVWSDRKREVWG